MQTKPFDDSGFRGACVLGEATIGGASARSEGSGEYVALLAVYTGHGVKVTVQANYN